MPLTDKFSSPSIHIFWRKSRLVRLFPLYLSRLPSRNPLNVLNTYSSNVRRARSSPSSRKFLGSREISRSRSLRHLDSLCCGGCGGARAGGHYEIGGIETVAECVMWNVMQTAPLTHSWINHIALFIYKAKGDRLRMECLTRSQQAPHGTP